MKKEFSGRGRKGQATFEYIFLLSLVITLVLLISNGVLSAIDGSINRFGGSLEKNLKTGRLPARVWTN